MALTKIQKERQVKVLNAIYTMSPISRIDISNQTGITPATVSDITGKLIEENLIEEIGEDNDSKVKSGRKKILLTVSNEHSFYAGRKIFCFCNMR
ncbi:MarR family transcriptional regulator [Vagococcus fluvialis]|uniref:MarR family transcriptional regulator n=1 Tax=Vagococcus fluvialis TaxID=2738 RepID=UPI001F5D5140|nr:helix-turn-helix domain-containing protein [Vagococcus fluvialis]